MRTYREIGQKERWLCVRVPSSWLTDKDIVQSTLGAKCETQVARQKERQT